MSTNIRAAAQATPRATEQKEVSQGKLSIRDVGKIYDPEGAGVEALQECSLEIGAGEFVAIVGPSGCGKSTLMNALAGFESITSGEVYLDGTLLIRPDRPCVPGADRVVVFQHGALFPWKTVLDNVTYGLLKTRKMSRSDADEKANEFLRRCGGLDGISNLYPSQLSSGMQRRVEIVRALVNEPKVLLLDEPFRAMDTVSKATMHQHLLEMYATCRRTIIFITHDIEEAIYLADTVVVMSTRPGKIKDVMAVKLPRPRTKEMMASDHFLKMKKQAINAVHAEAKKAFERGDREQA